jgi:hypothetical protein
MAQMTPLSPAQVEPLYQAATLDISKILDIASLEAYPNLTSDATVLVVLAAGKGTRFGKEPKCIQPVEGVPLAQHSIDAFRRLSTGPVIVMVGYQYQQVSTALGGGNTYVLSGNPTGGTAYAAYEAFCVPDLLERDPLLIVTMGDRIVPASVYERLREEHARGGEEADITFLTAIYEAPRNRGKGRLLRDEQGTVVRILEERDIRHEADELKRQALLQLTEGNCPLYCLRASTLYRWLRDLDNGNAQQQYYLTDIIERIAADGGKVRTITTTPSDPEYDLLVSDVTQPLDLAVLEGILASRRALLFPEEAEVEQAARAIADGRPPGQVASIARQLQELYRAAEREKTGFAPHLPTGIGIASGRLRIAFMHPDMARFFGPAWQMPIGAGDVQGSEQITMLAQAATDGRIQLLPVEPRYRENVNQVPAGDPCMFPDDSIADANAYEVFGTRMSESLLLSLGYFSDEELEARRRAMRPLPPASLWVSNSMRRPFALVGNAIASLRTLRGNLGREVQRYLGRDSFRGLRLISTGSIPEGGFSSSSALTLATKNAVNALFELDIPPDVLVHLACQAEYGTGVRAGSLDQATEQKGRAGQGTLISSNPRDNYRILGSYPAPAGRFTILFPYTVDRDRTAWRWSWGFYGESAAQPFAPLTTTEMRKMTGKSAEICALLLRLPLEQDFFRVVEADLMEDGLLSLESRRWVAGILRRVPLLISRDELREQLLAQRRWYAEQLRESQPIDAQAAEAKAEQTITSLLDGWRDAVLRRGEVRETGVPLRAMLAYLFGEVAKNFRLIHDQENWIQHVSRSQLGDRCFDITLDALPSREEMLRELPWERDVTGAARMERWMEHCAAVPFDFNRGLEEEAPGDDSSSQPPPDWALLQGSNFFRGLALIDLAEAMLKRAFGEDAVAVRVNAAGQGDYFQVHVDTTRARIAEVKHFLAVAFYRRFALQPAQQFVELHPGGGAAGIRLSRYDTLPQLIRRLEAESGDRNERR